MDFAERASQATETYEADALARHLATIRDKSAGASRTRCRDCGDIIPDERRSLVPGCERCVDCQRDVELEGKSC